MPEKIGRTGDGGLGGLCLLLRKGIFHTLHHWLTKGLRVSLIDTEITSELRALRCRPAATSLPLPLREVSERVLQPPPPGAFLEHNRMF